MEDERLVYRAVIPRPAPLSLSVIMGEAINQMRSSLDHLATAAARLNEPAARGVRFPAHRKQAEFAEWRKGHVRHMTAPQLDVIARYQPFAADAEPQLFLRAIVDFDNEAKHEVVPVGYAFLPVIGFTGADEVEFLYPETVEDGTLICRCRPKPDERFADAMSIDLAYGSPRGLIRQSTLSAMQHYVHQIVADIVTVTPEWNP